MVGTALVLDDYPHVDDVQEIRESIRELVGPGPDRLPQPEARLTLSSGPTPRLRRIPCSRNLEQLSPTELRILPPPARSGTEESKQSADQPLG